MNNEDVKRWRKALGKEEFKAKFPEAALKLCVDEAIESLKSDNLPDIGPTGNGLYHLGGGAYTGKKGYEVFIESLDEELKK